MLQQLQELFKAYTAQEDIILSEDSVILRDLGMNSYELVTLICRLEEHFDVEIPNRRIAEIRTVGDLISILEEKN